MRSKLWAAPLALSLLGGPLSAETNAQLADQVKRTETAFAKSMADRDYAGFATFLSAETIFMSGGQVLRGAGKVAESWKPYFQGTQAPFSWAPELVQVLDSGRLAMTSGPVLDPSGKRVGTFNSVWRREGKGRWRIVLDNGCPACDCGKNAK